MSPRASTTVAFLINGAAVGSWVAQIPFIQDRFDLTKTAVGFVIIGMSAGVVMALPIAGQAIARHGSERVTRIATVAMCLMLSLPLLAPHPVLTAAGFFLLGATTASMDVGMNSHGVTVERRLKRPIMSSLHAGWSLGGVIGAGLGALATSAGLDPRVTVALTAALLLALSIPCLRALGHGSRAEGDDAPAFALPSRGVLLIAVLCLIVMVTEGAMADWAALYLRTDLGAQAGVAALAFAFFSAGMTAGRLVGDAVNKRIGPVALLRWGALLTGVPLAAVLLVGEPVVALVGLFVIGLGVANGVPLMFSAAGRVPDTPAGPGIAAVSTMGSLGFLAGPPIIGFAADQISLPWALSALCLGAVAVAVLARRAAGDGAMDAQTADTGAYEAVAIR